jgi:hypothetical protein
MSLKFVLVTKTNCRKLFSCCSKYNFEKTESEECNNNLGRKYFKCWVKNILKNLMLHIESHIRSYRTS